MSKANITQLLNAASYKNPSQTRQDITNTIKYFKTLVPRIEKYVYPDGLGRDLICLEGTIPVTFKDRKYNIPVAIYVSDNHPHIAPMCYVRPTQDMMIKQSEHVDGSGRIYLPYLSSWNKNTSDILSLIQVMQFIFGNTPPVFQRTPKFNPFAQDNVAMPALPNTYNPNGSSSWRPNPSSSSGSSVSNPLKPVYPFSSNQPNLNNDSSTITEEHIRASLLSAVEDRLKQRLKEKVHQLQDEIEVLKKTSNDLNRGRIQLDEMKTRMASEVNQLIDAKSRLLLLDEQLQEFITKYDKEGVEINPDDVYGPTQPLFKQLLEAFAEENAVFDAIYYTSEGMSKGIITLDVFLKNVRELSRRQFMLRALMQACRSKASLPN